MATENTKETVTYLVQVRGPNGEEERCVIKPSDNPTVLKQRISLSPKFTTYTSFHFEVENLKGGDDLVLDEGTPFSAVPLIGNNSTLLVVPDMYNAKTIRHQIKYSIAMLSNKYPIVSQIVKFNADELPENLTEYTKQIEERAKLVQEKKEFPPLDLKERVNENMMKEDIAFKEAALAQGEFFPADDLTILAKLREAVAGEEKISIKSLSISSYNPPTASRLAMGDLIYLRMQTSENNVFHITGNASGFFANQSTDSVFNPTEHVDYPTIYPTLPAILCSLSSGFKSWFLKHRQVARSSNISSIIRSLPLMPDLVSTSKGWFSSETGEASGNLFDYADLMMDEALPVAQLKTTESTRWLNEYNLIRGMKGTDIATSLVISKEQSFASAAVHACKKIVDEGMQSLFLNKDTEPCYIVDDIFITSVAPKGSDVITPSNCNEEVANTRFLNSLDIEGLSTGLVASVDYKGHRFLVQSAVPGITSMAATNMIMWGSVDEGMTIHTDERVRPIVDKIAEEAHWVESKIHAIKPTNPIVEEEPIPVTIPELPASESSLTNNQEGTILGPVEGRIVRGTDNRLYAADYLHVAPVDITWREAHAKLYPEEKTITLTVRRQLVVQWLLRLALLKEQVNATKEIIEKKEKGEEVKDMEEKDLPELKKFVEITEKEIADMPVAFDVNAFTRYAVEDKEAEEAVRLLCAMISNTLIPRMVEDLDGNTSFYADTENIVALIHSSSLNVRYMGAIAEKLTNEVTKEQIEREMVARASKHILREILNDEVLSGASAFAVTAFLNGLLCDERKKEVLLTGKNKKSKKVPSLVSQHILKKGMTSENIWNMIDEEVKHHFHYTLTIWGKKSQDAAHRLLLLRRVCQQNGICLQAQQYDLNDSHVLRVENIIDFAPRVKFATTPNFDQKCSEVYQGAQSLMDRLQLEDAYEVAKHCLIQIISAHSQLHPQMLPLLNTMKTILMEVNEITLAVECCRAALYCSDAINGCDSLESAKLHTELAALLFRQQCYYESIVHSKIAVAVYTLLDGTQSARMKEVMLNLGMGYMNVAKLEEAVHCFDVVMTLEKGNAYLNACYYGCVLSAKMKKTDESAQYKKKLEEALEKENEDFRKTMLESLEKSLKELK